MHHSPPQQRKRLEGFEQRPPRRNCRRRTYFTGPVSLGLQNGFYLASLPKTSEPLWPPKPKLLDMATEIFALPGLVGRVVQVALAGRASRS